MRTPRSDPNAVRTFGDIRGANVMYAIRHYVVFCSAVLAILALAAGPAAARTTPFSFDYVTPANLIPRAAFSSARRRRQGDGARQRTRFDITNAGEATLTNPENGLFVTQKYQVLFKNSNFVTNADGTESFDGTRWGARRCTTWTAMCCSGPTGRSRSTWSSTHRCPFPDNIISQEITFEHGAHPSDELICQILAGV